jgi:DnaJ-class molecular chaperone
MAKRIKCPKCGGSGKVHDWDPETFESKGIITCDECGGTGYVG